MWIKMENPAAEKISDTLTSAKWHLKKVPANINSNI